MGISVRIGKKDKRHHFSVMETWIQSLARRLQKRAKGMVKALVQEVLHLRDPDLAKKAISPINDYPPLTVAEMEALRQIVEAWGDEAQAWVADHVNRVYAYGMLAAQASWQAQALAPPPSAAQVEALVHSARYADSRAIEFLRAATLLEIQSKDRSILDDFRRRMLVALEQREHPNTVAREMARDMDGDYAGWERISRTESARALGRGLLDQARELGADYVYVPETPGSCEACRSLLENRVFPRTALEGASNFGRKRDAWIPAIPLHPNCTHMAIPASQWLVEQAQKMGTIGDQGVKVE